MQKPPRRLQRDRAESQSRAQHVSGVALDPTLEPVLAVPSPPPIHGRGASSDPANRFEKVQIDPDPEEQNDRDRPARRTIYLRDFSRTIIAHNNSPDVGFETSVNPYRGCEHGCIYCYARPSHEYLGFSAGLDFESRIIVKEDAPELLAVELSRPSWKPQVIVMSGVTDPYQPVERRLKLTRRCLEVLARFRNPVGIITKNQLVTRDADLLGELAAHQAAAVNISVTSLDPKLQRVLEPRTSTPRARLEAIADLRKAGVPVGVMVAPIIPGLTDHEAPAILQACAEAGAQFAGYTIVRLPFAVAPLFECWLTEHFLERKEKVLGRIRHLRGGERLNDPRFKSRIVGQGIFAEQIRSLFEAGCKRAGIGERAQLSTAAFRRPNEQLRLFE
jgi:DNA repair photolyase